MKVFGQLLTMGVTVVVTVKSGDKRWSEDESFGPSTHLGAQTGGCWNEHDK